MIPSGLLVCHLFRPHVPLAQSQQILGYDIDRNTGGKGSIQTQLRHGFKQFVIVSLFNKNGAVPFYYNIKESPTRKLTWGTDLRKSLIVFRIYLFVRAFHPLWTLNPQCRRSATFAKQVVVFELILREIAPQNETQTERFPPSFPPAALQAELEDGGYHCSTSPTRP